MRGRGRARILIMIAATFAALLAAASIRADEPKPSADPNVIVEFDVARGGDLIIVPVTFGLQTHPFMLDTGASFCAIDRSLLSLVKEVEGQGHAHDAAGKRFEVHYCETPDGKIGPLDLSTGTLSLVIDLTGFEEVSGYDIRGIVGLNFLSKHVTRWDFDEGKLTFLKHPGADPGEPVAIDIASGEYLIEGAVGSAVPRKFQVDTGMIGMNQIESSFVEELAELQTAVEAYSTRGRSMTGDHIREVYRVGSVTIGSFAHAELEFAAGSYDIIGLDYLRRFVVTIDGPGRTLYLKPGASYADDGRQVRSGFSSIRKQGITKVVKVDPDTPAAKSGLMVGDELICVNRRLASPSSMYELLRACSEPDTTVEVRVKRGDAEHDLTIVLPPAD